MPVHSWAPGLPAGGRKSNEPLKVALVLSGAVALGSFQAGVVFELLEAVSTGAPLKIDLLAGSSAGSLVGAMAAKSLVMGVPHRATLPRWTEVTLADLTQSYETTDMALRRQKPLDTGILSSEAVRRIIRQHLVSDQVARTFQPAYPSRKIVLLMTTTNLDGLPGSGEEGDEARFSESITFTFRIPYPHDLSRSTFPPAIWDRVALVGMASSAFPGAFDPHYVPWQDRLQIDQMLTEEWENQALLARLQQLDPRIQPRMRYCDGGILDEQPIERAIGALVRVTGGEDQAGPETLVYDPRRVFLFIEPDPPVTTLEAVRAGTSASWISTFNRSVRLWSLSASPHTSQQRVLAVNARLVKLLEFLADLGSQMKAGRNKAIESVMTAAAVFTEVNRSGLSQQPTSGLIPPEIYADAIQSFYLWLEDDNRFFSDMEWLERQGEKGFGEQHHFMKQALLKLRETFLALYGLDPADPRRYQEVLAEVHLNLAENLGLSQPWVLLQTISPDDPKQMLRGEEAIHFGGFFARRFLEHDFEVGRHYARRWLKEALPEWDTPDLPEPETSDEGVTWALLWANRGPLLRMAGRLAQVMLEGLGLRIGGAGQFLVKLAGWAFVLSVIHAVLVTGALLAGWIRLPGDTEMGKFWVILITSLFPLLLGILIGLFIRSLGLRGALRWMAGAEGRWSANRFWGSRKE